MVGKLIITSRTGEKTEYALVNETTTIGREPGNNNQIDNLSVSGRRAQAISILKDSFLEDHVNTNGTYVNVKQVKKNALKDRDNITTGKYPISYVNSYGGGKSDFEHTLIIRPGEAGTPEEAGGKELVIL